jgi:superfamily II DNA or RNA helicase
MITPPDFIIMDEAHHYLSKTYKKILLKFNGAKTLGVTATPERLDGKGLGDIFQTMVHGPSVRWLIENGFLAKPVYYAPQKQIDVSQIKKTAGEFNQRQLADAVDKPEITGDAVAHYLKMCPGEQAIAFCVLLSHSEHICEAFNRAGIPAESIDGTMTRQERKGVMDRFRDGTTKILTSVDLIGEGVDVPAVGAAILLRPTQSLGLHLQQVGRCLRPSPGKTRAVILDHAGNCLRHGLAETEREWTLEDGYKQKRKKGEENDIVTCVRCYAVYDSTEGGCPQCGLTIGGDGHGRELNQVKGELIELTDEMTRELAWRKAEENKRCKTLEELVALGKSRGYRYPMQWARKLMAVRNSRKAGRVPVFA